MFEAADGGSVFLDEIGDLALALQAKLLRVLQEGEVRRVGETHARPVDVRVVSATNRRLPEMVAARTFRSDLYHRLAGYTVRLPPLRQRGRDIITIASDVLKRLDARVRLSRGGKRLVLACRWPGNVRQLQNVMTACWVDAEGEQVITDAMIAAQLPDDELPDCALAGIAGFAAGAMAASSRVGAARAFLVQHGVMTVADGARVLARVGANVAQATASAGARRSACTGRWRPSAALYIGGRPAAVGVQWRFGRALGGGGRHFRMCVTERYHLWCSRCSERAAVLRSRGCIVLCGLCICVFRRKSQGAIAFG